MSLWGCWEFICIYITHNLAPHLNISTACKHIATKYELGKHDSKCKFSAMFAEFRLCGDIFLHLFEIQYIIVLITLVMVWKSLQCSTVTAVAMMLIPKLSLDSMNFALLMNPGHSQVFINAEN